MTALDRLTADPHPNDRDEIGTEDGETCNRYLGETGDEPRAYRQKRCEGVMVDLNGLTVCDTCGEYVE